jgi:hypothetical protein
MKKIEFQDYPSTETPLNAGNMNGMQTNIEEEFDVRGNAIEVSLSVAQTITGTDQVKVNFDEVTVQSGELLTLDNNGIKIGKGISTILVNYTLWIENNKGYGSVHVFKNNEQLTYNIQPQKYLDAWNVNSGSKLINVEEGDIIYIYVRFSEADSTNKISKYGNSNRLIVSVIS